MVYLIIVQDEKTDNEYFIRDTLREAIECADEQLGILCATYGREEQDFERSPCLESMDWWYLAQSRCGRWQVQVRFITK